jgi:PAS domain S-box-containing protein
MNVVLSDPIRILLVEDLPADAAMAKREILGEIPSCEFLCVEDREGFLAALANFEPRVIVADYSLPRFDGLTALRLAQEYAPLTPLIILTGSMNEDTAVDCMKAGASNYVIKEQIKRLGQSVRRALVESRLRHEHHAAEQALQKNEQYFRSLIENVQDLITVLDAQGLVVFQSPSVQRALGYAPAELLNRRVFDLVHPEDLVKTREFLQRVLTPSKPADSLALRFHHADGSWRILECLGTRLGGDDSPTVVVNARDVTERSRLEQQLRQAQKMEAIGQLASGVAHDFNNVLTSIMGNASILRHDPTLGPELTGSANEILVAAERAASLTRKLLLFSRRETLQLACLDLNESVKQIVKMLQRILGETIAIDVDYAPGAPLIRGDAGMIDQILLNLAVNARDAMSAGGRLAIKTEILPPVSQSEGAPLLPAVRLSVSDTGCGIRPEHLPHIFEPFFTTKEPGKGTGLGLATVYGIVKQHEGSIEITTNLGQGTTFQINFPGISSQTTAAGRVPTATTAPIGSNELILLVEDELPVRSVVTRLLQRNGYQVLTAQSGPEALKVWAENRDSIRLLLTDMVMPDGMTGRELASEIRALVPQLPVIYSSGYSPDLAGRLIEVQPGTRFLQKPYSSVALAQAVRESLAEAATKSNPTAG